MTSTKKTIDLSKVDISKMSKKQLKKCTNKKQRLAMKEAKKKEMQKSERERIAEVNDIKKSLLKWEMDDRYEPVEELFSHLDLFIATGQSVSGKIPFPQCPPQPLGRVIVYNFNNTRGHKGTCDLMVRNGQDYVTQLARKDLPDLQPGGSHAQSLSAPVETTVVK